MVFVSVSSERRAVKLIESPGRKVIVSAMKTYTYKWLSYLYFQILLTNDLKFGYLTFWLVQKLIAIPKEDYCNITSLMIVIKQLFVKKHYEY